MLARRTLLAGALAATVTRPALGQQSGATDLLPSFWPVYDAGRGESIEARARAVIAGYFQPHLAVQQSAGIGRIDLVRWLEIFDPIADEVRRLSLAFPQVWREQVERFRRHLPDATNDAPMTIMLSFLSFDARVRLWRDRLALFVGLDGVVHIHGRSADLGILLDHECFHLYHHQVNPSLILPGGDTLWLGIWKEGLAVHACGVLNPGITRRRMLLGDSDLAAITPELLRRIARALPPVLGATDGQTRARYLSYGYRGDIPARSGYALGLAIAERVARGRSLGELARIPAPEIETLVRAEVEAIAD
ncbi:MAG: hypothetical protein KF889_04090 [Alphaproteobacteria bacterium]|nr:hypothetical protein [Alphaproteobacteria bacterium]MCW5742045.1 hypothetical protein [Alphaproteobacteria bacterium]